MAMNSAIGVTACITPWNFPAAMQARAVAPALAAGAFCGAYFGGHLGLQTNETTLRWGFSGLMVTLGIKALIR